MEVWKILFNSFWKLIFIVTVSPNEIRTSNLTFNWLWSESSKTLLCRYPSYETFGNGKVIELAQCKPGTGGRSSSDRLTDNSCSSRFKRVSTFSIVSLQNVRPLMPDVNIWAWMHCLSLCYVMAMVFIIFPA